MASFTLADTLCLECVSRNKSQCHFEVGDQELKLAAYSSVNALIIMGTFPVSSLRGSGQRELQTFLMSH